MKILFVCTGNICRSPIAERMLEDRNSALGLGFAVTSAGIRARTGQRMHPESQRALRERGLDADGFSSRLLTERIVLEQDLILGLTRDHRAAARQLFPARWGRVIALREVPQVTGKGSQRAGERIGANDPALDILDPIGQGSEVFDAVAADIEAAIDRLTAWMVRGPAVTGPGPMPWSWSW